MTNAFYLAKNSFSIAEQHTSWSNLNSEIRHETFFEVFFVNPRGITRNGMARGASESPSDCKLHSKRYIRAAEQFCCLPQMAGDKLTRIIPPFIQRGR
ncbi:hypothetical protein CEXT_286601 [Caerostris extrusa]|uniref:Uncharacterized protein n=1 Tax=Caerostris extrusa TaxID=172846 RepID=A0AAV4SAC3_CAEEX|nr:hypothetical protein CEXT_286601 [Caerostris extrusa]